MLSLINEIFINIYFLLYNRSIIYQILFLVDVSKKQEIKEIKKVKDNENRKLFPKQKVLVFLDISNSKFNIFTSSSARVKW